VPGCGNSELSAKLVSELG
jgi:ubiquinone/menaquinone biosynthesis C-methylase UbiE